MIKPQKDFPLIELYKRKFRITNGTIFAYYPDIYTDWELPNHLLIHEEVHLQQQKAIGRDEWCHKYLNDPQFRLDQEVEAYVHQLRSLKNPNVRRTVMLQSAKDLSSSLYGSIISLQDAIGLLKQI